MHKKASLFALPSAFQAKPCYNLHLIKIKLFTTVNFHSDGAERLNNLAQDRLREEAYKRLFARGARSDEEVPKCSHKHKDIP